MFIQTLAINGFVTTQAASRDASPEAAFRLRVQERGGAAIALHLTRDQASDLIQSLFDLGVEIPEDVCNNILANAAAGRV